MAILHFYSDDSPICIDIMYVPNQWLIKKNWYYQSLSDFASFKIDDDDVSYEIIYELVKTSYNIQSRSNITVEITKDDKPILLGIISENNFVTTITRFLTYLKSIDKHDINRLYKSYVITNTNNILTKTFPAEIINHILTFI